MDVTSALLLGALAGLAVAVPVGPIGVLLLREGVVHGTRVAIGAGLGVATVDLLYATVAVAAGAPVGRVVAQHEHVVRWVAAAVLVVVAVLALRAWWRDRASTSHATVPAAPRETGASEPAVPGQTGVAVAAVPVEPRAATTAVDVDPPGPGGGRIVADGGPGVATVSRAWVTRPTPAAAYVRFVGLTIVNPATLLIFATVAVGLAARLGADGSPVLVAGALFVAGAGLASAAWQTVLGVVSGALGRVVGERGRSWASPVGAVVVLVLAGVVLLG
ncbi:LysE family transporter [Cellulomonas sp. H30R-01]|uniref:LysE family transporter n=1 Tax=Cellulomonas sp. H30R-01 TaxID=2704467 RepID=UPI00138B3927|nr:LysE family transporter [Cellulomonas sp. H30R-01]QHT57149.1 LysE family transporter [Cellulomonas sp. H30R-01]